MKYLVLLLVALCSVAQAQIDLPENVVRTSQHDIFNQKGQLSVRIVYSYGESGNVVYRTLYSYDARGRITRRMQYSDTDYLMLDESFAYDKHGNIVGHKTKFFDPWLGKSSYKEKRKIKYDREGKIIYRAYYIDGKLYFEDPPRATTPTEETTATEVQPTTDASTTVVPATDKTDKPAKKQKNKKSKKRNRK